MPEARVIPFDGDSKRGTRRTPTANGASRTGAARGSKTGATQGRDGQVPVRERTPRPVPAEEVPAAEAGVAQPPSATAAAIGSLLGGVAEDLLGDDWARKVAGGLAFLRRRLTGEYEVDEFGFDAELTDQVLLAALRPLYEKYFRVETRGLENVPDAGGALVVANHSGTIPLDSVMTQLAVLDHHPAHRHLRMLAADLVFTLPFIGEVARKAGHTLACSEDAQRLLGKGELVGVWPEGFKGIGKSFSERYKLQRFGRGGFVSAALRTGVPIIPVSVVGAEEIYPILGNAKLLARLFGVPYLPFTPTFPWLGPLGMIPLPSKWIIAFGEPIPTDQYGPNAADDPMLVFNLTDQVRETIQHTLYKLLMQRRSVFF
jgi:1-acyl-sn-glycerol-3-phosphate acyltransferase